MAAVPEQEFAIDCLDRSPRSNLQAETTLRKALSDVLTLPHAEACAAVVKLDREHHERLDRPWAKLGDSLLAESLVPLSKLAAAATSPLGGPDVGTIARAYAKDGWEVDRHAMRALAVAQRSPDAELVGQVVRAIYLPWLDKTAAHFQSVCQGGSAIATLVTAVAAEREQCLVFADGLRFDVAVALQEKLEARGLVARLSHRIAPLPSVTATAKPAVMPLPSSGYGSIVGGPMPETFLPQVRTAAGTKPATTNELHGVLGELRVAVLGPDETDGAATAEQGGWTEVGRIDELGHKLLRDAGWRRVHIVTDHGWLLVPGGLPKTELPKHQAETRWGRCAVLKDTAHGTPLTFGWDWCKDVQVAYAPGVSSFIAGADYAHGGLSLQECLVPVLDLVVAAPAAAAQVTIKAVTWKGLRCVVEVDSSSAGLTVDVRTKPALATSSLVASVKPLEAGKASVAVADDDNLGAAAVVVILGADGQVLQKQATTVGG